MLKSEECAERNPKGRRIKLAFFFAFFFWLGVGFLGSGLGSLVRGWVPGFFIVFPAVFINFPIVFGSFPAFFLHFP